MVMYMRHVHNVDLHVAASSTAFGWALGLGFVVALVLVFVFLPVITRNVALLYDEDGARKPVSVRGKCCYWFAIRTLYSFLCTTWALTFVSLIAACCLSE